MAAASATYFSARQAAEQLGVCERTVRRWISAGRLAAVKQGREFRIAAEDLLAFSRPGQARSAPRAEPIPVIPGPADEAADLADLARELQEDIVRQSELAALWQARAAVLSEELRRARAQLALRGAAPEPDEDEAWGVDPEAPNPPSPVGVVLVIVVILAVSLLLIFGLDLLSVDLP